MPNKRESIRADLIKGAVAGAVATWVMDRVTTIMYQRERADVRRAENEARGGRTAYETAAEKAAVMVGSKLDDDQAARAGMLIHWALGIGAGAAYAVVRRRLRFLGKTAGTAFGTGFWALMDEGIVPMLGLTPGPRAFPWQTHARGLAGHLSFGTVAEGTLRILDAVA